MFKKINLIVVLLMLTGAFSVAVGANYKNSQTQTTYYDMVIIGPADFQSALDGFIEHKNSHNILTTFVSTQDIYDGTYFEVQGRDAQEKIKYFIKDALETWGITYVLFVGDSRYVPVRFCYNFDNYSNAPEYSFVSELYYADIYDSEGYFSAWDADSDGVFGEWVGDTAEDANIDLKPDVCLGRLACRNKMEVTNVVKKIIDYERQPAGAWFNNMVVAAGDTYDAFEGYEGELYNQQALDQMTGFTPVKLWASEGSLSKYGGSIIKAVNAGCGFLYLSGHGSQKSWVTYSLYHKLIGKFTTLQMLFLFNKNKLPVCVVEGCHNSEFATNTDDKKLDLTTQLFGCWSWALTNKKQGGAIATVGATGLCWYSAEYAGGGSNSLNLNLFTEYATCETNNLGIIWRNALIKFISDYPIDWESPAGGASSLDAKSAQEWVILGDPSLKIGGYPLS